MPLIDEKYKPFARILLSADTCPRCVLRFCCVGSSTLYRLPYQDLADELQKFVVLSCGETADEDKSPPSKKVRLENTDGCDTESQSSSDRKGSENPKTCTLCLGILQHLCNTQFVNQISYKVQSAGYEFKDFVLSVSLPAQQLVREHAAWLQAQQEMRKQGLLLEKSDIIQLKEAFKWIIQPMISEELKVQAVSKGVFEVGVVFCHQDTDEDCHFLATVCRDCFKPTKNKQSVFTRMAVVKALDKIKDSDFWIQFPWPPPPPKTICEVVDIQCNHASVFVAGRYNKYSRTLSQTPWIIDGERKMESSVEELITEQLMPVFKADRRPFAIELVNPHKVQLSALDMKDLQQKINSSDKIKVRDFQIVSREAVAHMKEGEEEKTKCYSALIWTEKSISKDCLDVLDNAKELKIVQKTPLRVLHRRPLASRPRVIHTMKTQYVDEHHFRLYLKTQAGTYIKEFVHGDFGRTVPNIGSILKTTADILELDVESVDVDWPPALED